VLFHDAGLIATEVTGRCAYTHQVNLPSQLYRLYRALHHRLERVEQVVVLSLREEDQLAGESLPVVDVALKMLRREWINTLAGRLDGGVPKSVERA